MYDKIAFKARINTDDIPTIVFREYLEQYVRGDEIFYKSTAYANLTGVTIEINGDILKCKCSVNKQYYKKKSGHLDNSLPISFSHATRTIRELLMRLLVRPEDAIVTYFEVGLTMKMLQPPDVYIKSVRSGVGRSFWNDPNFPEMKQKITEKSKYYRKILKMYDKTFECSEKGKKVSQNTLRLETMYRHQSVDMVSFLSSEFQIKLGKRFYDDWNNILFNRELKAKKGVKMSQLAKAQEIYSMGLERYLEKYRTQWKAGEITRKNWQTYREYGNAWKKESDRYIECISDEEQEYKDKLLKFFQIGFVTSKS